MSKAASVGKTVGKNAGNPAAASSKKPSATPERSNLRGTVGNMQNSMEESAQDSELEGSPNSEQRAKVFAALSDPTRVRLAQLLARQEELTGTELAEELDISLA